VLLMLLVFVLVFLFFIFLVSLFVIFVLEFDLMVVLHVVVSPKVSVVLGIASWTDTFCLLFALLLVFGALGVLSVMSDIKNN
jgi:hypothetical protein